MIIIIVACLHNYYGDYLNARDNIDSLSHSAKKKRVSIDSILPVSLTTYCYVPTYMYVGSSSLPPLGTK